MKLSGWGRYPRIECKVTRGPSEQAVRDAVKEGPQIARGNGRSYGDAALGATGTLDMRRMNRMISFDMATGVLVAEAGTLLEDILSAFVPRGFFPLVTPGTKYVTLGGMIAADVHGKNHHIDGSMRCTIDWLDLMLTSGAVLRLSRDENADLFDLTVGGMGLTGVILRAAIRLRPIETAWIKQTLLPADSLDEAMALFEANQGATYSVAWIDCLARGEHLGRSLVMLGEHAQLSEVGNRRRARPLHTPARARKAIPFDLPIFTLNKLTVSAFNRLYWWKAKRSAGVSFVDWDSYFYPLDAILGWNRIYGRKGFVQFQCVIPLANSADAMRALLETVSAAGQGSFLAVLKRMGPAQSAFSFPMEGYTLALDFPATQTAFALLDRLHAIVKASGGRIYLAKDARLLADELHALDPRAAAFRDRREALDPGRGFTSNLSERLSL
ncbi:FAD-dependent oxidoreductase [Albirhodobacter sp. R86504]|uniref:FAD-dependent oxidoreductase n=1 Tax=Albirhodobacter sp. R86504 TaxID=3093848 RepID=UPI00366D0BE6